MPTITIQLLSLLLPCFSKRQAYLLKGKELLKLGKKSEAHECFQKSVNISPEIALAFIKVSMYC